MQFHMTMTKNKPFLISAIVLGVLVLGVLVSMFGNVGIRGNVSETSQLLLPESLLPGVPFTLNWTVPEGIEDVSVLVVVRSGEGRRELTATKFYQGNVSATLPCETSSGNATVQLVELSSGQILLQAGSVILAAGPDCVQ